jgi:hypothetical protein
VVSVSLKEIRETPAGKHEHPEKNETDGYHRCPKFFFLFLTLEFHTGYIKQYGLSAFTFREGPPASIPIPKQAEQDGEPDEAGCGALFLLLVEVVVLLQGQGAVPALVSQELQDFLTGEDS